jgi:predicted secreted hydrolase
MRQWLMAMGSALALCACAPPAPDSQHPAGLDLVRALGPDNDEGYAKALAPSPFQFPQDHGPHHGYRNEWWYFTGHLRSQRGRRFGFQLTLFRIALAPPDPAAPPRGSRWAAQEVYMGHVALSDLDGDPPRFHAFQRLARAGAGLAGASASPLRIWLEDWEIRRRPGSEEAWHLAADTADFALELDLLAERPVVAQGDHGLSRKGATPGNASYYYSIPRLSARGRLTLAGRPMAVAGSAWLDREWSTRALEPDQVGWDWFALQLDDGHELMYYQLRRRDGGVDPHSEGSLTGPHGKYRRLTPGDLGLEVLAHWDSPRGGRYPARWGLNLPDQGRRVEIIPLLTDQELDLDLRYWEGAVEVREAEPPRRLIGQGYVELTGYAQRP